MMMHAMHEVSFQSKIHIVWKSLKFFWFCRFLKARDVTPVFLRIAPWWVYHASNRADIRYSFLSERLTAYVLPCLLSRYEPLLGVRSMITLGTCGQVVCVFCFVSSLVRVFLGLCRSRACYTSITGLASSLFACFLYISVWAGVSFVASIWVHRTLTIFALLPVEFLWYWFGLWSVVEFSSAGPLLNRVGAGSSTFSKNHSDLWRCLYCGMYGCSC